MKLKRVLMAGATGLVLAVPALSQPSGMGPGMMGGDYGSGPYGMGHGMMGGPGAGDGRGYDMHPGMGGWGMSPGMMGGWGSAGLDLSADQRAKVATIQRDFRHWQWETMEKMHDLEWRSSEAAREGKFDEQAERRAYDQMATLRKQMFENSLEARKRFDAVLTPQQREQMQQRRGWRGR